MDSRKSIRAEAVKKELLGEQSLELLKELHLLTRDGALNADARRKLKQVNHLYGLIFPLLTENSVIADLGSGKSYLGFIIYDLFLKSQESGSIINIEERQELVENSQKIAQRLGFDRMTFLKSKVSDVVFEKPVSLLTALHACDTATDDAIILGLKNEVPAMALVPCCQAEVASLLEFDQNEDLSQLWRHGVHRREMGSHLTNVIRCLVLESFGYKVTATELIGWEHSLKNEVIIAKKIQKENKMARQSLEKLIAMVKIEPKLIKYISSKKKVI